MIRKCYICEKEFETSNPKEQLCKKHRIDLDKRIITRASYEFDLASLSLVKKVEDGVTSD